MCDERQLSGLDEMPLCSYAYMAIVISEALVLIRATKSFNISVGKGVINDAKYIFEMARCGHDYTHKGAKAIPATINHILSISYWSHISKVYQETGIQYEQVINVLSTTNDLLELIGKDQKVYDHNMPSLLQAQKFFSKLYDKAKEITELERQQYLDDE